MNPLPLDFYQKKAPELAQHLIGKKLCSHIDGHLCSGIIVETEAYVGATDKACHAYQMRRTPRTEVMYAPAGVAYLYLCYGIHHLFNVVAYVEGQPHAVLISALEPIDGIEMMMQRRKLSTLKKNLTNGPGSLAKALGLNLSHNGLSLLGPNIWIEENNISSMQITTSKRINIAYAEEDAELPLRYCLKGSKWLRVVKS